MRSTGLHCCSAVARLQQLFALAPRQLTSTTSHRQRASAVIQGDLPYDSSPVQQLQQVPTPMCRRPGQHVEQLAALMDWRQSVLQEIMSVKDSFAAADGGPSTSELQAS